MTKSLRDKKRIIFWLFFILFNGLLIFWGVVFSPPNMKYFNIVYLAVLIFLLLLKIPFKIIKSAWVFFLLILIHVISIFIHIFDVSSVINLITLALAYTAIYYMVTTAMSFFDLEKLESAILKFLLFILALSFFMSSILTFIKWPYSPAFYPWQALTSNERFLLIVGKDVGHSNAMWLMAFSLLFLVKNILGYGKVKINGFIQAILIGLLTWGLIETESRTALIFIGIIFLAGMSYKKFIPVKLYALIPIISISFFFLGILSPNYQTRVESAAQNLQNLFPSMRIASSTNPTIYTTYAGRDVLNIALLSSFAEKPWFGHGDSASILLYGVNQYGEIAYTGLSIAESESMLRMLVKYGSIYFIVLMLFTTIPLFRTFSGYYADNTTVIAISGIILISGLNGPTFENLYDISAVFTTLTLIYLITPSQKIIKRKKNTLTLTEKTDQGSIKK